MKDTYSKNYYGTGALAEIVKIKQKLNLDCREQAVIDLLQKKAIATSLTGNRLYNLSRQLCIPYTVFLTHIRTSEKFKPYLIEIKGKQKFILNTTSTIVICDYFEQLKKKEN